jgi:protein TonB
MKPHVCFVLLSAFLAPCLLAQTGPHSATQQPYEIQISASVAEKLLLHKPDLVCPQMGMAGRFTGIVVVAIEIDQSGDVHQPKIISGPAMLRKAALDSVRNYKYKPYLLNGNAVDVETTVLVAIDSYRDCHYN